jgi:mRNA interferase MazF
MVMNRGDIWWGSLQDPIGSSPGYRRPVLVIQDNNFTRSLIKTVVVAVISSKTKLAKAKGNVLLTPLQSGLSKDSVVNVSQILTIDKTLLFEFVETLTDKKMEQVDKGLRLVLNL